MKALVARYQKQIKIRNRKMAAEFTQCFGKFKHMQIRMITCKT